MTLSHVLFSIVVVLAQSNAIDDKKVKFACQAKTLRLYCPRGFGIQILSANYGRTNEKLCNPTGKPILEIKCISPASKTNIETKCNKKRRCSMVATNKEMGGDPCPGVLKYVDVIYKCVSKLRAITTDQPTASVSATQIVTRNETEHRVTSKPYSTETHLFTNDRVFEPNTTVNIKPVQRRHGNGGFFRSMLVVVALVKDKPKHSMLSVLTGVAAGTVIILVTVLVCVCMKKRRDKKAGDDFTECNGKKSEVVELEKSELLGGKTGRNSDSGHSGRTDDHVDSAFGDDEPDRGKTADFEMANDMAFLDSYLEEHNKNKSLPRPRLQSQDSRGSLKMSRRAHNDGSKGRSYNYNSNNDNNNYTTFS